MKYLKVSEVAEKWGISERSVRNYCANDRVDGAVLIGKIWHIPETATKPKRLNQKNTSHLLNRLRFEKKNAIKGGIYHKVQIDFTYNSNHMEGSRLSREETRYIYETNLVGSTKEPIKVDDIVETANHFRCIDTVISEANKQLTEALIKKLHFMLKNGTEDSRKDWFLVGEYKKLPNEVGGKQTTPPEQVRTDIQELLGYYNKIEHVSLDDILDFHFRFERIHPFQDGNGRVGRLIMFKECLKYHIVPFIIEDELKYYYYRGLNEWEAERGFLRDTALTAQDKFKAHLDYFGISY